MKDHPMSISAKFLGETYKKEDNRTEGTDPENLKDVGDLAESYHQAIRPEGGSRDSEKAWHEKWWGDILIGLAGILYVFFCWFITTPNAWCKLKVC